MAHSNGSPPSLSPLRPIKPLSSPSTASDSPAASPKLLARPGLSARQWSTAPADGHASPPYGSPSVSKEDRPSFLKLNDRSASFPSSAAAADHNHLSAPPSPAPRRSPVLHTTAEDFEAPAAEDAASAHVRQVYAQLDQYGVAGDGWAEGVELTRERRGRSASPQQARTRSMAEEDGDGLATKERDLLRRADRYGFFEDSLKKSAGGMARLVTLPRSSFATQPSPGGTISPRSALANSVIGRATTTESSELSAGPSGTSNPAPSTQKELRRIRKWSEMLVVSSRDEGGNVATWSLAPSFPVAKFRRRVWKGVPDRWRRAAWSVLVDGFGKQGKWGEKVRVEDLGVAGKRHSPAPSVIMDLNGSAGGEKDMGRRYREAVDTPGQQDVQIDLDVPRTISGNVFFHTRYGKGQRALFHVLHAWGLYCETCGYCQGMGAIAATFLGYYESEAAYSLLVALHDRYGLHSMFAPGFPGLVECFYVQERLVEALMPDVYRVLLSQSISSSAYATKWYITLFSTTLPFSSHLRLLDAYLLFGLDVLVLAAVSIVWALRPNFISSRASFESILSSLSCFFVVEDEDAWMEWIRRMAKAAKVRGMMRRWREEWKGFVRDGSAASRMT